MMDDCLAYIQTSEVVFKFCTYCYQFCRICLLLSYSFAVRKRSTDLSSCFLSGLLHRPWNQG